MVARESSQTMNGIKSEAIEKVDLGFAEEIQLPEDEEKVGNIFIPEDGEKIVRDPLNQTNQELLL